jgi:hypothetical protein
MPLRKETPKLSPRFGRRTAITRISTVAICKGRTAIEDAFKEFFKENKALKLRIDVKSVRFVTPDVAVEDGTSSVIPPDGSPPSQGNYTNVHIKKGGQWVLQSVHEAPYTPPGNYEHLHGLDWAVGEWVD